MKQSTFEDFQDSGVECPTCGEVFKSQQGMKSHHAQVHGNSLPQGTKYTCDWCGDTFRRRESSVTGDHTFCGEDCWGSHYSENITGEKHHSWAGGTVTVKCENCGTSKEVNPYQTQEKEKFFCDKSCQWQWQKENFTGQGNPAWKNGSSSPYIAVRTQLHGERWGKIAERVRRNANYECEFCGESTECTLNVHHIIPVLAGGVNEDELLMALCDSCHAKVEAYCSDLPGFDRILAEE